MQQRIKSRRMVLGSGLFLLLMIVAHPFPVFSQVVEHFVQADFADAVGSRNIIGFDEPEQADNALTGGEYLGCGVTIVQRDGNVINVIGNTVPGAWGANYVTEANVDTPNNVISTSAGVSSATQASDNFDFVFSEPTTAAGIVIGNIGNCGPSYTTTVQFLDAAQSVIAEAPINQTHPDIFWGTAPDTICGGLTPTPFDNRLFYGVETNQEITSIRVINGVNDSDGVTIDSVQFASERICSCGFESGAFCVPLGVIE